jgi:hypothetical protein
LAFTVTRRLHPPFAGHAPPIRQSPQHPLRGDPRIEGVRIELATDPLPKFSVPLVAWIGEGLQEIPISATTVTGTKVASGVACASLFFQR